jgi:hypothetical protein
VLRRTWDTRWRRRAVSVVEAEVNGDVYEFTFARDSHLLVRLVAPPPGPNKPWECQLADYTPGQGIPMPAKVTEILSSGIKATERNTYALNVDYDERIFVEPPTLTRGPKGLQRPRGAADLRPSEPPMSDGRLPHRVLTNSGGLEYSQQVSYQINVAYAPGLFSRPARAPSRRVPSGDQRATPMGTRGARASAPRGRAFAIAQANQANCVK